MKAFKFISVIFIFMAILCSASIASERENYRIGIGLAVLSPTKDILVNRESTFGLNLGIEARANDHLDAGARYGMVTFKSKTSNYDATYGIYKMGVGGRYYLLPTKPSEQNSRGLLNLYVDLELDYYQASKVSEIMANSPAEFKGWGGTGLVGVEMALGSISGYADAGYQRTSIKSSDSKELPLDGFVVEVGGRIGLEK